jgi:hypothetical protein
VEVGIKGATTFSHFDSGLTKGVTYYYRVYSYNDAGLSIASDVVSGTPDAVTSTEERFTKSVRVYPNPFHDRVYVEVTSADMQGFELVNMEGQVLLKGRVSGNQFQKVLDVSYLPTGMYVLKLTGKSSHQVRVLKR